MNGPLFLLPRLDRLHAAAPSHPLWLALGRADRAPAALELTHMVPHQAFEVVPTAFGEAAVTRLADCGDAGMDHWMRADPCWLQPDISTLRMMACGDMQLSSADADDLAAVLRPIFGDAGIELSIPHPERWYLKLATSSDGAGFSPPRDVLGDDVERHIPQGATGLRWRRLLNEVQMSLHDHALNRRRQSANLAPVNSLWFWGAGRLPNRVRAARARCYSADPVLIGLSRQSQTQCGVLPGAFSDCERGHDAVVDLRQVPVATLLTHWLEPALRASRRSRAPFVFGFAHGERFELRRPHRWRFWRRPLQPPNAPVVQS